MSGSDLASVPPTSPDAGGADQVGPVNVAGRDVLIGTQVDTVHGNVVVYQLPPDASPDNKYAIGVNYLDGGMPSKARTLISEAYASGHASNEVQFHWLLALLTGKTSRQLSSEDRLELSSARTLDPSRPRDAWAVGIEAIDLLLAASQESPVVATASPDETLRRLDEIGSDPETQEQWTKILRHLDLLHRGSLRNQIWARAAKQAERDRFNNSRRQRAWKFFQPEPAGPRVTPVAPVQIRIVDWVRAAASSVILLLSVINVGQLLARGGRMPTAILLLPVVLLGMYVALRAGSRWLAINERARVVEDRYRYAAPRQNPPMDGFAHGVDRRFAYYFARYTPRDTDRDEWLRNTDGIRRTLRDEIVETYRESAVSADQVAWLIRFRVGEVRRHWEAGTLLAHRKELRAPWPVCAAAVLSVVMALVSALRVVGAAVRIDPLPALGWTTIAALVTWWGARSWLRILGERRRHEYDRAEHDRRLEESSAAYARWWEKLRDSPEDSEIEAWLDADRQVILQRILEHYRLTATDLLTQAFIEAPEDAARHARVKNGPWRYTHYRLVAFLLTSDGVRQVRAELEFIPGTFLLRSRINYRYDNVGSVHVLVEGLTSIFELSLNDGQRLQIPVIVDREELLDDETAGTVNEVTLEAAGIDRTLHILEGIAAEGKNWIRLEEQRGDRRLSGQLSIPGEAVADVRSIDEGSRLPRHG